MPFFNIKQSEESIKLEAFSRISGILATGTSQALTEALGLAKDYLKIDSVRLGQIVGSRYILIATSDSQVEEPSSDHYLGDSWCRVVSKSDHILDNIQLKAGKVQGHASDEKGVFKAYLGAAVSSNSVRFGTIALLSETERKFTDHDRFFLKSLSNWLTGYLQQTHLKAKLVDYDDELDASTDFHEDLNKKVATYEAERAHLERIIVEEMHMPVNRLQTFVQYYTFDQNEKGRALQTMLKETVASLTNLKDRTNQIIGQEAHHLPEIEPHKFSLSAMILEVAKEMELKLEARGIVLNLMLPPNGVTVFSDEVILKEIFRQVMSNAVKFSPFGGEIRIELLDPDHIEIWVQDFGPGIPSGKQEEIFEKFTCLSQKAPDGSINAGLGLFIAKEFSALLDVEFEVYSEESKGTQFGIFIPRSLKKSLLH